MLHFYVDHGGLYSLQLPADWVVEEGIRGLEFFQPETGVGGVNVRLMTPGPLNAVQMLRNFVPESIAPELQPMRLPAPLVGASVAYEIAGEAWRVFAVWGSTYVLMISYRCDAVSRGIEDATVDRIVGSAVIR